MIVFAPAVKARIRKKLIEQRSRGRSFKQVLPFIFIIHCVVAHDSSTSITESKCFARERDIAVSLIIRIRAGTELGRFQSKSA